MSSYIHLLFDMHARHVCNCILRMMFKQSNIAIYGHKQFCFVPNTPIFSLYNPSKSLLKQILCSHIIKYCNEKTAFPFTIKLHTLSFLILISTCSNLFICIAILNTLQYQCILYHYCICPK